MVDDSRVVTDIGSSVNYIPNRDLRGNVYDDETSRAFYERFRGVVTKGDQRQYAERFHLGYYVAIAIVDAADTRPKTSESLSHKRALRLNDLSPDKNLRRFYGWNDDMFGLLECNVNMALQQDGVVLIGEFKKANDWNDCYQATLRNFNRNKGHIGAITRARAAYASLLHLISK